MTYKTAESSQRLFASNLSVKFAPARRAVYDFKRQFKSRYEAETDCSVVHVRRSDVVLHDDFSRKYFPVTDYVQLIPSYRRQDPNQTVLLLTDDANAIDEAHEFHPELRWKYINRTRYKGTSGGWEHQTPSNNPASEVITLLATFDLVQECSLLIHGSSKFSEMLWYMMLGSNRKAKQRRVDANADIYSKNHSASEFELMKRLNDMRSGPKNTHSDEIDLTNNATASTDGVIIVNILGLLANDLVSILGESIVQFSNGTSLFDSLQPNSSKPHLLLE